MQRKKSIFYIGILSNVTDERQKLPIVENLWSQSKDNQGYMESKNMGVCNDSILVCR